MSYKTILKSVLIALLNACDKYKVDFAEQNLGIEADAFFAKNSGTVRIIDIIKLFNK